jgi:hypothetical protein
VGQQITYSGWRVTTSEQEGVLLRSEIGVVEGRVCESCVESQRVVNKLLSTAKLSYLTSNNGERR